MKRRAVLQTLGEKLFDLGNLAAAALLFGKALAPEEVPSLALVLGIILVYMGQQED